MTGEKSEAVTSQKIRRAIWWLSRLGADTSLSGGDLCAKAADTANRLLTQCCVTGLKEEYGWDNAELARQVGVAGDRPGRWLAGENTASPKNLAALWRLYQATRSYKRAAATVTDYLVGDG